MTMNDTWGFKTDDTTGKAAGRWCGTLVDIASKGGNLPAERRADGGGGDSAASRSSGLRRSGSG